jgi:hypothetical protein
MNWTALVYGAPMLIVMAWWAISARKWFKGPKINVEHHMLGRGEMTIEGVSKDESSDDVPNIKSKEAAL